MNHKNDDKLTRRQFSRTLAGTAASLLAAKGTDAQTTGEAAKVTEKSSSPDPRIAWLETGRNAPFTEDQRKGLPVQLKDMDDTAAALRKYALRDGGSEPDFVFHPEQGIPTPGKSSP